MITKRLAHVAVVSLGLAFASSAYATNGYFIHGVGTKSNGMAGAGVALPQDAMIAGTNPAGMVFVGNRTDLGLALFSPRRSYQTTASQLNGNMGAFTIGPNNLDSGREWFVLPNFARNWMIDESSSWGITLYGNGGMNTTWTGGTASFDPDGPGPAPVGTFQGTYGAGKAGVDLAQMFVNLSYARKTSGNSAIGGALILAAQRFRAEGVGSFAPFTRTFAASGGMSMPTRLTNNDHEMSYGFGAKVGFQSMLSDTVSVAGSYQSRIYMSEFDDYADLFAESGDFDIPPSATIGIAFDASENFKVAIDVQHTWFSDVDSVGNPIANIFACPTAGAGGTDLESCLGGERGAGFGWDDVTTFKIGGQWAGSNGWTWRAGYSHAEQPIGTTELTFNILAPGVVEDHLTFGFTKDTDQGEWNFAVMHALNEEVSGPNSFDPTQSINIEMNQFSVELGYSWEF
ncbi:MAG: hypothetical protein HKM98_04055 [Gammaproteobacteria bacterium]|nr:hypothetical protein [Gammaproteobacteria bacterium]